MADQKGTKRTVKEAPPKKKRLRFRKENLLRVLVVQQDLAIQVELKKDQNNDGQKQ